MVCEAADGLERKGDGVVGVPEADVEPADLSLAEAEGTGKN